MTRKPEIDPNGKGSEVISTRFSRDIIEILSLLTKNRSKYVRDATYEKIEREIENSGDTGAG